MTLQRALPRAAGSGMPLYRWHSRATFCFFLLPLLTVIITVYGESASLAGSSFLSLIRRYVFFHSHLSTIHPSIHHPSIHCSSSTTPYQYSCCPLVVLRNLVDIGNVQEKACRSRDSPVLLTQLSRLLQTTLLLTLLPTLKSLPKSACKCADCNLGLPPCCISRRITFLSVSF